MHEEGEAAGDVALADEAALLVEAPAELGGPVASTVHALARQPRTGLAVLKEPVVKGHTHTAESKCKTPRASERIEGARGGGAERWEGGQEGRLTEQNRAVRRIFNRHAPADTDLKRDHAVAGIGSELE